MAQLTLYHGSKHKFDRPDPHYFGTGDGQSMAGVGFYGAKYPDYAKEHIQDRIHNGYDGINGGVVYSMQVDIPDDRILNRYGDIDAQGVGRFAEQARLQGNMALAEKLTELKKHIDLPRKDMYEHNHFNGEYMSVENGKLSVSQFYQYLERSEGSAETANFFRKSGIDAILVPNNQYSHYVILNQDVIKGNMAVHEVIGSGPLRNNPGKLMENGQFFSESLSRANLEMGKIDDAQLKAEFKSITSTLLSDEYMINGLGPRDAQTSKQNMGYDIRSGFGSATSKFLNDGPEGGQEQFERLREYIVRYQGADDPLLKRIDAFENSLNAYSQKIHGIDFSAKADGPTPDIGGKSLGQKFMTAVSVGGKALGVVGAATVGLEAMGLHSEAQAAVEQGLISEEAGVAYDAILMGHVGQGTFDPTMFGGEKIIQATYDQWVEHYGVPDGLRDTLRPGSLADIIPEIVGKAQHTPEQQAVLDLYDKVPAEITADMPPDVRLLAEIKQGIVHKEQFLEQSRIKSPGDMVAQRALEDNIRQQIDASYGAFETEYETLKESGGLDAVHAHLDPQEQPALMAQQGAPVMLRTAVAAPSI